MGFGVIEVLAGSGILFLFLYYYLTSNFDFWERRNVKGPKPVPFFGNFKDSVFGKTNIALVINSFYDQYKNENLIGIFGRSTPLLIVKDPELIKNVLIKDFNIFPDRGLTTTGKTDPFSNNLLTLEHERWRPLRNKLSPVFSSSKLKDMFYLIADCAQQFEEYAEKLVERGEPIECRELTAKYTTDAIGVCAFGLNTNALGDENSGFRKSGRDFMDNGLKNVLRRMFREWFPKLYDILSPIIYNRALDFFINTMKESIQYRRNNNVRRNDFVDLMMDLKDHPDQLSNFEFTDTLLTAQAIIFFLAGFDTSSLTITNTLYELALHPHVQDKLRQEIQEVYKKDGKLTYDNIKSMKYLDKVLKEALRKYPPGGILQRQSAAPYTFAGTNVAIPKKMKVIVPVRAIHYDPEIYPDPDVFDPERFDDEQEKSRHPMHYLPFGHGPHNCIGLRFANYQTKIGIAVLINKFKVDVCDKTRIPYKIHPRSFISAPLGGVYVKMTKT